MKNDYTIKLRIEKHLIFILTLAALLAFAGQTDVSAQTQFAELTNLSTVVGQQSQQFGNDVAIDGNTMIFGAKNRGTSGSSTEPGAAFIYVRNANGSWTLQQALTNGGLSNYFRFGSCVGISGDTVVVGAPGSSEGAFIFTRSGTTWTQQTILSTGLPNKVQGEFCALVFCVNNTMVIMNTNLTNGSEIKFRIFKIFY